MGVLEDKRRARVFYRYLSTIYDRINPLVWNEQMRDEIVTQLDLTGDERILDVGCGTGFATTALIDRGGEVHALDQSVHQLTKAWDKLGKFDPVRFTVGDAERLPYADDSFDLVWSSGSIEYWPRPVETLRELRRVARPGGQVVVVGPDAPSNIVFRKLADAIMFFYDESEADRMFESAGFESFEHSRQQATPTRPKAITTVATVPDD